MPPGADGGDRAVQLVALLRDAFSGAGEHSLLRNLEAVRPGDWTARPAGGRRTIRDIVQHVGGAKFMYEDYAFGPGALRFGTPLVDGSAYPGNLESARQWLHQGHERLLARGEALTDADLARPARTNWGEWQTVEWVFVSMLQHDLYHAGEINHLRALLQRNDRWEYDES